MVPYCYLFLLSVFILWFRIYVSDIFCKFLITLPFKHWLWILAIENNTNEISKLKHFQVPSHKHRSLLTTPWSRIFFHTGAGENAIPSVIIMFV